jgi:hypothetical protein
VSAAVPLPPLGAVLLVPRRAAVEAFVGAGWRAFAGATPLLDAERRRLLNLDLTDPDVALERDGALAAVAHVETDRDGLVTHVEVVGAAPEDPHRVAVALAGAGIGAPRMGGGADAREWVWGPESGATLEVGGEPIRLWICAERAYGDRLWAVATVVRRG